MIIRICPEPMNEGQLHTVLELSDQETVDTATRPFVTIDAQTKQVINDGIQYARELLIGCGVPPNKVIAIQRQAGLIP